MRAARGEFQRSAGGELNPRSAEQANQHSDEGGLGVRNARKKPAYFLLMREETSKSVTFLQPWAKKRHQEPARPAKSIDLGKMSRQAGYG
jgi:hypothetical protein